MSIYNETNYSINFYCPIPLSKHEFMLKDCKIVQVAKLTSNMAFGDYIRNYK